MKNITFTHLIYILTISKILISLLIGDTSYENEWEIINTNLINYGELSYYFINDQRIPSIYMPPLYSYFLYLFHFFNLEELYTVSPQPSSISSYDINPLETITTCDLPT